jgi:hypothetical protein
MFVYSQLSRHAQRFGLRSSAPTDLYRFRIDAALRSPIHLGGRCKSRQQLFSLLPCFRCETVSWSATGTGAGENLTSFLRDDAEAKGVLL